MKNMKYTNVVIKVSELTCLGKMVQKGFFEREKAASANLLLFKKTPSLHTTWDKRMVVYS